MSEIRSSPLRYKNKQNAALIFQVVLGKGRLFSIPNLDGLAHLAEATDFSCLFLRRRNNQIKKNQFRALRAEVQLALY